MPVVTNEEELVRGMLDPGKVWVTGFHNNSESEDTTEDFRGYACDVQQRVSGTLQLGDLFIQRKNGLDVEFTVHPEGCTPVSYRDDLGMYSLTRMSVAYETDSVMVEEKVVDQTNMARKR